MARHLRVEYPGAIYHVTVRMLGSWPDDRRLLFRDNNDRERLAKDRRLERKLRKIERTLEEMRPKQGGVHRVGSVERPATGPVLVAARRDRVRRSPGVPDYLARLDAAADPVLAEAMMKAYPHQRRTS